MNTNTDTPGGAPDAISHAEILQLASESGLKLAGDDQTEALLQFADDLVDRCAGLVEQYKQGDRPAGQAIREAFGLA
jgi:hypothetical protein